MEFYHVHMPHLRSSQPEAHICSRVQYLQTVLSPIHGSSQITYCRIGRVYGHTDKQPDPLLNLYALLPQVCETLFRDHSVPERELITLRSFPSIPLPTRETQDFAVVFIYIQLMDAIRVFKPPPRVQSLGGSSMF